jgi:hypothetical protein
MTGQRPYLSFVSVFGLVLLISCHFDRTRVADVVKPPENSNNGALSGPKMVFDTTSFDFGRVYEGEVPGWYFHYWNKGDKDLVITEVKASCGCTTPEYSSEALAPGMEGRIRIAFDSGGRWGYQYETVTVTSNSVPAVTELTITGQVVRK